MGKYEDAYRAIHNGLAWLAPLQQMRDTLAEVRDAEKFLVEARPQIDALRVEEADAVSARERARTDLEKVQADLRDLQETGKAAVDQAVGAVRAQMEADLTRDAARWKQEAQAAADEYTVTAAKLKEAADRLKLREQELKDLELKIGRKRQDLADLAAEAGKLAKG